MNASIDDAQAPTTPTQKAKGEKRPRSVGNLLILSTIGLLLVAVIGYQLYEIRELSQKVALLTSQTDVGASERHFGNAAVPAAPRAPRVTPFGGKDWDLDRWDPRAELQRMQQEMNQLFGSSFSRFQTSPQFGPLFEKRAFSPSIDVEETKDAYITRVDVPGASKANLDVEAKDNVLYIRGETERETDAGDSAVAGQVVRKERFEGHFERAITLPSEVDPARMTSKYENGVLTITLPKKDLSGDAKTEGSS